MNHSFRILLIPVLLTGLTLCFTSCKPKPTLAVVTTTSVTGITQLTATSGGNVTDDGNTEITARGVCWGTSQNPATSSSKTSDGTGTGIFTSSITGLTAGNTYYVRAYATNSEGTSYGNEVTFSSNPVLLATLTTTAASSVTKTTAVSGGNITLDGGGAITGKGVCWSTTENPTTALTTKTSDGSGSGVFTSNISGLTANTKYYIRAFAVNSAGTAYGNQEDFTTDAEIGAIIFNPNLTYGTVTDVEGNIYKTIQIGTQTWTAENLRTTKLNDNTQITLVTDNIGWSTFTSPSYCWYDNDASTYKATYGALYNRHAVNTAKLCPTGWHIPSDTEWTTLITFLGGQNVAGGKLKETGMTHWQSPNGGATNETGFSSLPTGQRSYDGVFGAIATHGYMFSTTYESMWGMFYLDGAIYNTHGGSTFGESVRCLKD